MNAIEDTDMPCKILLFDHKTGLPVIGDGLINLLSYLWNI